MPLWMCCCCTPARRLEPICASSQLVKIMCRPPGSRPRCANAPAQAPGLGRPAAPQKRKPSAAPQAAAAGAEGAARMEGERAAREGRAQGPGKRLQRSQAPQLGPFLVCCRWKLADLLLAWSRRFWALLEVSTQLCSWPYRQVRERMRQIRWEAQAGVPSARQRPWQCGGQAAVAYPATLNPKHHGCNAGRGEAQALEWLPLEKGLGNVQDKLRS